VVRYSKHAREKMAERGISEEDVESALSRPSGNPTPGQPGTIWLWGYAAGSRILKVCVPMADHEFVITAAWPGSEEETAR
jgi:hypothetical protein